MCNNLLYHVGPFLFFHRIVRNGRILRDVLSKFTISNLQVICSTYRMLMLLISIIMERINDRIRDLLMTLFSNSCVRLSRMTRNTSDRMFIYLSNEVLTYDGLRQIMFRVPTTIDILVYRWPITRLPTYLRPITLIHTLLIMRTPNVWCQYRSYTYLTR